MQTVISDGAFWEITIGALIFLTILCFVVWKYKTGRSLTGLEGKLLNWMRRPPGEEHSADQKPPAGDSQPPKKKATHN